MRLPVLLQSRLRSAWTFAADVRARILVVTVAISMTVATVFYRVVEGWSLLDAFYMSAMTITTVGYGDYAPTTAAGKLFTVFYAFGGIGIVCALLGLYAGHVMRPYERRAIEAREAPRRRCRCGREDRS